MRNRPEEKGGRLWKKTTAGGKRITLTYSPDASPKDLHRKRT